MNSRFASFLLALLATTPLPAQLIVSHTDDSGEGSLRRAITDCPVGGTITFDASLSGEIITLGGSQLAIEKSLTIDASSLPAGIIIDGGGNGDFVQDPGESRCFFISDGDSGNAITVAFQHLTIQNGSFEGEAAGANIHNLENLVLTNCHVRNGRSFGGFSYGGAIYQAGGSLSATACTISGNQTQGTSSCGGGIYNLEGDLSLNRCTFSGNRTQGDFSDGGAICSNTDLDDQTPSLTHLINCTIFGNTVADAAGGGILNVDGLTIIESCTIVGNSAADFGSGVSSFGDGFTETRISDSIVRDNSGGLDLSLFIETSNSFSFPVSGRNLIGTFGADISGPIPNMEPLFLAPLADYGGPTQTMMPLPASPAIDGAISSGRTTDQRGFPIFNDNADIGAVEFQGAADLPIFAPAVWDIDHDGDGISFGVEHALGTDPFVSDAGDSANLCLRFNANGQAVLEFGYNTGAIEATQWILERSSDLAPDSWEQVYFSEDPDNGGTTEFDILINAAISVELTDITVSNPSGVFYRFRAGLAE
ncbi:MAG: choice-of-anchor Q domain-containing protein [Akkermansiaceae bacterium]|nr:choice-of-anchor Q domain-containing protein [Akkermansiaceae bacterium]